MQLVDETDRFRVERAGVDTYEITRLRDRAWCILTGWPAGHFETTMDILGTDAACEDTEEDGGFNG